MCRMPGAKLSWAEVRREFGIVGRNVPVLGSGERPLVYLDHAASTHAPHTVLAAFVEFMEREYANVHRGTHLLSRKATERFEEAYYVVADFIGAELRKGCVVFTANTTHAIDLCSHVMADRPGKVITTEMEHHSNLVPWQMLAEEKGAELRHIPVDAHGRLDLANLDRLLEGPVKLVSFTWVSNALGTINPVLELTRRAHAAGAVVFIDAAQAVPHLPVDFQATGADFLAFSGHKMLGPTGIGALIAKREHLESMPPFFGGGEMIREVTLQRSTWADPPSKFEAGTMNFADAVGLGAAIDYLAAIGMEAVHAHGYALAVEAIRALEAIPGVTVYGPPAAEDRGAVLSFTVDDIHAHDVAGVLDREGVAVRAGHHCAMPLHARLGVPATARASFTVYNDSTEVERLAEGVRKVKAVFHR
ncbi:MAG TPA: cysteine desulfurase [Candidatus Eisenbacteria bacterium]|nr:cysteine desulfurase [Candidatus Eisenbacteria bacterium]